MERYLIESPHTDKECVAALDAFLAAGYLNNFEWGCEAGVHCGYVIIEAESEGQALMAVPPHLRGSARAVRLNKFDASQVLGMHGE